MLLLDTYAWIEIFSSAPKCEQVKQLIAGEKTLTATPVVAELSAWALRNGRDPAVLMETVKAWSTILALDVFIAQNAGKIHFEFRKTQPTFGMVDAMIYATALSNGAQLLTGDKHFQGKPGVVML